MSDRTFHIFLTLLVIAVVLLFAYIFYDIARDKTREAEKLDYCVSQGYTSVIDALGKDWCVEVVDGKLRGVEVELQ